MKIKLSIITFVVLILFHTVLKAEDLDVPTTVPPDAKPNISQISEKTSNIEGKISAIARNSSEVKKEVSEIAKKDSNIKLIESENKIRLLLSSDILFDFDKYEIKREALETLKHVNEIISKFQDSKIILEGHTDAIGNDNYNYELSVKRAKSVRNWFVQNGSVSPANLECVGHGETQPVEENSLPDGKDNPVGRQKNRRVEIVINKNK
jgi:outer membrane protein OmpA-like peptidoglycan-associated protein